MTLTVAPFDKIRARRLPAEQRREHLLDVGAAIILDSGFETLTMESVAERAGVSKGLGYAYFENAEELALALYDREMAEFIGESSRRPPAWNLSTNDCAARSGRIST